uniref:Uncharacterized protein n=1 Tax=Panagrolaimus sp. JU765 TaxID=591449 RepID=A0AC34RJY4_9BILA
MFWHSFSARSPDSALPELLARIPPCSTLLTVFVVPSFIYMDFNGKSIFKSNQPQSDTQCHRVSQWRSLNPSTHYPKC